MQNKKCWSIIFSDQRKIIKPTHLLLYTLFKINKGFISLFDQFEGSFFMNTDENQKNWIDKVHQNLMLRGRSEKTFDNYKSALMRFLNYYDENAIIGNLKEDDIINFLNKEYLIPNKCKDSYNVAVCAIRLMYLVCFNISLNKLLLPTCKLVKRLPTTIPTDIFVKIVNDEKNLRHKCWLLLAFFSGLRVSEVASIKVEDVNAKEHKLKVLGKGNKERYTILPNIVIKALRAYCIKNNIKSGFIFKGNNNTEKMNDKTIINYFSVIKDLYNLDNNITFHSLRHSFATNYLKLGGNFLQLQSMLGHNNLNTTTIYLHLSHNFNDFNGDKYV